MIDVGDKNISIDQDIENWFISKSGMDEAKQRKVEEQIKTKCVKSTRLLEELDYQLYNDKMNGQFYHGKKMIALQLRDLGNHLNQLMEDMKDEALSFKTLEEELQQEFKRANIQCFQIDVLSNTVGERVIICSFVKIIVVMSNIYYVNE